MRIFQSVRLAERIAVAVPSHRRKVRISSMLRADPDGAPRHRRARAAGLAEQLVLPPAALEEILRAGVARFPT
jgi:hypothetical protein